MRTHKPNDLAKNVQLIVEVISYKPLAGIQVFFFFLKFSNSWLLFELAIYRISHAMLSSAMNNKMEHSKVRHAFCYDLNMESCV